MSVLADAIRRAAGRHMPTLIGRKTLYHPCAYSHLEATFRLGKRGGRKYFGPEERRAVMAAFVMGEACMVTEGANATSTSTSSRRLGLARLDLVRGQRRVRSGRRVWGSKNRYLAILSLFFREAP